MNFLQPGSLVCDETVAVCLYTMEEITNHIYVRVSGNGSLCVTFVFLSTLQRRIPTTFNRY